MRIVRIAFLVCCFAALAFAQGNPDRIAPSQTHKRMRAVTPESQLMQLDADFNRETQKRRDAAWMDYLADNVVMDRAQPIVGKEAAREALKKAWANPDFSLTWRPTGAHVFEGGTMGFTWGYWESKTLDASGKPRIGTGQYLTVWRKQKDGKWKIIWDGGADGPEALVMPTTRKPASKRNIK